MIKRHFPEVIETARLVLRKHQLAFVPQIFSAVEADRDRLRRHLDWVDFTFSVEDEYAHVHQTQSQWDRFEVYDYSLFDKAGNQFLGHVGVHNISWANAACELGYWIIGAREGEGLVREATDALIRVAFREGFYRVEIRCAEDNPRSQKIPRSLGFRPEGRLRAHTLQRGVRVDVLVFAKLKSDG